ncbi:hypothetical protein ONE63_011292 [Megalurothrips usitatus]|uniref:DUF4806 domain-containing protein n=1 Tax=Megalurothrips usitatus TaxID=439358 RepID=A0AAV7X2R6_9NEOP|nr:hypothetical protein ONE63_011292 [Megalurothrips usitatus]
MENDLLQWGRKFNDFDLESEDEVESVPVTSPPVSTRDLPSSSCTLAPDSSVPMVAEVEHGSECVSEGELDTSVHAQNSLGDIDQPTETGREGLLSDDAFDYAFSTSIVFDCDVCFYCKCVACNECFHLDGQSCQHCDYCVKAIDSDLEQSESSDEDEFSIDVDENDLLSGSDKRNNDIKNDFVDVVLKHNITQEATGSLLQFFRKHNFGDFPKSPATLLKTPSFTVTREVPPGRYWHRGITKEIIKFVNKNKCINVRVTVSTDGLPLAKSSGGSFWPICCCLNDSVEVFLVGLYYGSSKPLDCNLFLEEFVEEMKFLEENGIDCNGAHVTVGMHVGIFDTPAKAFVLNVNGHAGYCSCCKCTEEGVKYGGRMAFRQFDGALRTDESFRRQLQDDHHHGPTILTELKTFRPVTNVVLDYMHLCLLGVLRTLVFLLISGPMSVRQGGAVLAKISEAMESLYSWVPVEFVRKSRSLKYVKRFKATEWRMLLFYLGVVVFSHLPRHLYELFLVFHVAMTIFARPDLIENHLEYGRDLMMYFIRNYEKLVGKPYVVHNIHNLSHLWIDVRNHGPVHKFDAFKFENFLQTLKRMVRKGEKPLEQVARRYEEKKLKSSHTFDKKEKLLSGLHCTGPLPPGCFNPQYSSFNKSDMKINLSAANCCCVLKDGSIILVENIAHSQDRQPVFVGKKFLVVKDLYSFPCSSQQLGICHVSKLSFKTSYWLCTELKNKCFRMPHKGGFAVIPLIHGDQYFLNDYEDGPQLCQGCWLSKDRLMCAWPPNYKSMDQLTFDKFIQDPKNTPKDDWIMVKVLRVRACGDSFSKMRLKLRDAEEKNETDLNTAVEDDEPISGPRRSSRAKAKAQPGFTSSDSDDAVSLQEKHKILPPTMKKQKQPLTLQQYKADQVHGSNSRKNDVPRLASSNAKENDVPRSQHADQSAETGVSIDTDAIGSDTSSVLCRKSRIPISSSNANENDFLMSQQADEIAEMLDANQNVINDSSFFNDLCGDPSNPNEIDKEIHSARFASKTSGIASNSTPVRIETQTIGDKTSSALPRNSKIPVAGSNMKKTDVSMSQQTDQIAEKDTRQSSQKPASKYESPQNILKTSDPKGVAIQMAKNFDDTEFKAYMIANVNHIRATMTQLTRQMSGLTLKPTSKSVQMNLSGDDLEDALFGLPAELEGSFREFDEKLADKEFARSVRRSLSSIVAGMKDWKDVVRKCLAAVMANNVASTFSLCGKRGKNEFMACNFYNFILAFLSHLKNDFNKEVEIKIVRTTIADWLRLAAQRAGGTNFEKYSKKKAVTPTRKSSTKRIVRTPLNSPIKKRAKKSLFILSDGAESDEGGSEGRHSAAADVSDRYESSPAISIVSDTDSGDQGHGILM